MGLLCPITKTSLSFPLCGMVNSLYKSCKCVYQKPLNAIPVLIWRAMSLFLLKPFHAIPVLIWRGMGGWVG